MKPVAKRLRAAGVVGGFTDNALRLSEIPSWAMYRLAWDNRVELCAIAIVRQVMRQPMEPIKVQRNCTFCRKYQQYTCETHAGNEHGIPAAILARGCDQFDPNMGLYF
jgi:hypothetical protein